MKRVRILLIDEHAKVRKLLVNRLASYPDFDIVGDTGDADEGLRLVAALTPDLVLLDTKMSRANGLDLCRQAGSFHKNGTKVAILSSYADPMELRMARDAGATGFLLKDLDTKKLAGEIKALVGQEIMSA